MDKKQGFNTKSSIIRVVVEYLYGGISDKTPPFTHQFKGN